MKKLISPVLVLCSMLFMAASLNEKSPFPPVEKFKLRNGLEVLFADFGDLPVTSVNMYFNVGKKSETPGQQGISGLIPELMLLGNSKYSRVEMDRELFRLGAELASGANDNFTVVSMDFLNRDADKAMDILSATVISPSLAQADFDERRSFLLSTNKFPKMDITGLADIFGDHVSYGISHPLGRHFYEAQMKKITTAQLKEFYSFNYTPGNCKMVVTGKTDRAQMKQLIEKYFGGWSALFGEVNGASYEIPAMKSKEYYFVPRAGAKQTAITWSKRAPASDAKDLLAFRVANSIFSDRLMAEIREKRGYTYGIYSGFSPEENNGIFRAATQVRNEVLASTLTAFDEVLSAFYTNGITQKELDKERALLKTRILSMEDPGELASAINPWANKDYEKQKGMLAELDKLDVATVNKSIRKYFTPGEYKAVICADPGSVNDQLGSVKGLQKLDFSALERDE